MSASGLDEDAVFNALVDHGLDFIDVAAEALVTVTDQRSARLAVLHLAIGVELLLKARLLKEHWSLVFEDVRKATPAALMNGDLKSVAPEDCLERLSSIADVRVNKHHTDALKELRKTRNALVHLPRSFNTASLKVQA